MQIGPKEIAQRLNDQAEGVCRLLLPHGKKSGHEWVAGDIHGGDGKSLSINLNKGVGQDFANPDSFSGDMLELWKQVKGIPMRDAIKEAKSFLGIEDAFVQERRYKKPDRAKMILKKPKDEFEAYLTETRLINTGTLQAFKIGTDPAKRMIVFPRLSPEGELIASKSIGLDRDPNGKKIIDQIPGCAPNFFGWQAMDPDASEVVVTEGEIDAMTWHSMGFPAISIGAVSNAREAICYDWDNLQQFETIYLCPDNDKAGQKMIEPFVKAFGKARLRIIKLKEVKDPNDARQKGWLEKDFREALADARDLMADEVVMPSRNAEEIKEYILRGPGKTNGDAIPLLGDMIRLIPGHAILISGATSTGKSQIIQQAALEIARVLEQRVAICSLESDCLEVIKKMVEVDIGKPSVEFTEEVVNDWIDEHPESFIWMRRTGLVTLAKILDFFEFARSRFGCEHFILDNLTKLSTKADDYAQQAADMNVLTDWCRDSGTILWALAHHKKHGGEKPKEDDFTVDDVRGSSAITDLTSVALVVYRNRRKEKSRDPNKDEPDTWVHCIKQRSTGKEPSIGLFVERDLDVIRLKQRSKISPDDIPEPKPEEQAEDRSTDGYQEAPSPNGPGLQGDEFPSIEPPKGGCPD
jgi:twinkle protein